MGRRADALPWALTGATVAAQIAYPLTPRGRRRDQLSVGTVLLFGAASLSHAATSRGPAAALALAGVAGGGGLVAEAVGTSTGVPFGAYRYAGTLGPQVLDVPVVIPVAWTMMAYPAVLGGRHVTSSRLGAWAAASATLAAWDLFLDPQMVDAGHWEWLDVRVTLPGIPDVPVSNFAGWLLVSGVICGLLELALPRRARAGTDDSAPFALLLWTWAGSTLAHGVFWRRPAVAAWGGAVMGAVGARLARRLRRDRRLP
jgi:uncharacterized membrane protein